GGPAGARASCQGLARARRATDSSGFARPGGDFGADPDLDHAARGLERWRKRLDYPVRLVPARLVVLLRFPALGRRFLLCAPGEVLLRTVTLGRGSQRPCAGERAGVV